VVYLIHNNVYIIFSIDFMRYLSINYITQFI